MISHEKKQRLLERSRLQSKIDCNYNGGDERKLIINVPLEKYKKVKVDKYINLEFTQRTSTVYQTSKEFLYQTVRDRKLSSQLR